MMLLSRSFSCYSFVSLSAAFDFFRLTSRLSWFSEYFRAKSIRSYSCFKWFDSALSIVLVLIFLLLLMPFSSFWIFFKSRNTRLNSQWFSTGWSSKRNGLTCFSRNRDLREGDNGYWVALISPMVVAAVIYCPESFLFDSFSSIILFCLLKQSPKIQEQYHIRPFFRNGWVVWCAWLRYIASVKRRFGEKPFLEGESILENLLSFL